MQSIRAFFTRIPKGIRVLALGCLGLLLLGPLWIGAKILKTSHSDLWVPTFLGEWVDGRYGTNHESKHFIFLMSDHWEPGQGARGQEKANNWISNFEAVAANHLDSQGRKFQYSWFYPIDNFDPVIIDSLANSSRRGFGEIEVHWHHHHSGNAAFEADLKAALPRFTAAGALVSAENSSPRFGFIHGNWTLDNSGDPRFCGADEEIRILQENGCYADFTFPSLGTPAQPRTFNRIFYTEDTPEPKSYDLNSTPARKGIPGSGFMMIPGPLGLDFKDPRILMEYGCLDDAQVSGATGKIFGPEDPADYFKPHRVDLWNRLAVGIEGKPEWVFVKIHAHGVQHRDLFFGGALDAMLTEIEKYCADNNLKLHYVTAREAYNLVKAAEADAEGSPEDFYDFEIPQPLTRAPYTNNR